MDKNRIRGASGGTDESAQIDVSPVDINYSCVQGWTGGFGGTGNIGDDPSFVDPDNADYRLGCGSPCIDAADNTGVPADEFDLDGDSDTGEPLPFDLDGEPRFVDDPATEDTGYGDPSYNAAADFDHSGCVGLEDLLALLANYGHGAWRPGSQGKSQAAVWKQGISRTGRSTPCTVDSDELPKWAPRSCCG